ncbi:Flp pilus assembly protein CpaB [Conexibacter woesei]|uniref:Flp pilus assembly protein CpaB n=1 Tax=Conexibacter woesei TaxID=191495 RepID=UPI00040512D3|nr:Flp pilus assembly protein CpaB [Conexibacter woesei]
MTRRRRTAALLGLAALLGGLAASDVAGREAALDRALGPTVTVVVARTQITAGTTLDTRRLTVRRVPARFAPHLAYASPDIVAGARAAADLQPGEDLTPAAIDDGSTPAGAPVRPGERVAELVADGPGSLIHPGSRVDVLVTRSGADGASGTTSVALEDAEVLAAHAQPDDAGHTTRVAVSLRTTARQAVYLAAAQSFARDLRLLPRATGDRRHGLAGTTIGSDLR